MLARSFRKTDREGGWFSRRKRYTEWWIVAGTVRRLRDMALERAVPEIKFAFPR